MVGRHEQLPLSGDESEPLGDISPAWAPDRPIDAEHHVTEDAPHTEGPPDHAPVLRLTYPDTHPPFSHVLEAANLPDAEKIATALRRLAAY